MSTIHNVAIAGATGSLGSKVTEELVKAGFTVTALTRDASTAKLPHGVKAVSVDYSSQDSLIEALKGQDALVSTVGSHGIDQQLPLFKAAFAAGVKRLIPSEFGSDTTSPTPQSFPAYKDKVEMQTLLKEKAAADSNVTYTIVQNNAFLDWGVANPFLANVKAKTANLPDGGDVPFTVTPLNMIGQGVAGILKHPAETANRVVRIHGAAMTMRQIVELVQKHTVQEGWTLTTTDTEKDLEVAYGKLKSEPQNFMAWAMPMIFRAAVGKGMDINWEKKNDDELLGLKPLTYAEVEQIIKDNAVKQL